MKKLLSILVILLWLVFPSCLHAEAQLLIDRLKQEGMLIPEPGGIFNSTSNASEISPAPSPVVIPEAAVTAAAPAPKVTLAPASESARTSEKELAQLKRQLSKAQRELQTLTHKYRALTGSQPQRLSELAESFRDENKQLQQQLMAAEKQIAETTRRHEKQEKALSTQIETLKAEVASRAQVTAQAAVDKSALQEQRAALAVRDAEIAQLTVTLSAAEKQNSEWATRLKASDDAVLALNQQLAGLEKRVLESETQNAALIQNIKDAETEKAQLEQQQAKFADSDKAKAQLENLLAAANKSRDAAIKERDEIQLKLVERDKTLAQINTEHSQSVKRLETLEAELNKAAAALDKAKEPAFSLKKHPSEEARINYASGVYYATKVRYEMKVIENAGYAFSAKALQQGMKDKLNGTLQLSEEEVGKILTTLDRKVGEVNNRESEGNKQKSDQFVAQAAKAKGAEKSANGVVYQVMKKGTLPLLSPDDVIRFKLDERISTGKMISKGEIRAGQVGRLPDLMQQGVRRLGVGGKIKITVPWQLAYGEQGIPGTVPPGVASELTIEVTGINK